MLSYNLDYGRLLVVSGFLLGVKPDVDCSKEVVRFDLQRDIVA